MRNALKWSALFVMVFALASIGVFAQNQGGGIQGKVTDAAGQPVIGATIQVSGPALQGFQGTAADTNGQYMIPFLPVGTNYQVKVEAPGYNTVIRKDIQIPLGVTISLPFTLIQGKTEIVVTATAPVIDQKTTTIGANISGKMINSIPLPRNAMGIAYLSPGVVSGSVRQNVNVGPSMSGGSGPENQYTVNGVDVTGTGYGLNNTSLNFDFIEATEVKIGGLSAEYGALMGGAVNSITKSGGNEFHGSLYAYYFKDSMGAKERKVANPTVVNYYKAFKRYDIGGSLGGYIKKDKLWFFAAYDYNDTEQTWTANGGDNNVLLNGQPSYSWAKASGYKNKDTNPMYAVKLTWNISPKHKLSFTYFGNNDKYDNFHNANNLDPTASPYQLKTDNYAVSAQWNATWTPKFFTEALIAYTNTKITNHPTNPAAENNWGYYYRFGAGTYAGYQIIPRGAPNSYNGATGQINLSSWAPSLGGRVDEDTEATNTQIRVKATNLFNFVGRHELSYGFQKYDITFDYNFNYTGPGFTERTPGDQFFGDTTSGGVVVRWQYHGGGNYLYRAQGFMNNQAKNTKQHYNAYWVQDNWNLSDYFMLKLGVRLDQLHMQGGDNYTTLGQPLPHRTLSIDDMLAPRLGFTWDIAHNNKSKLYGFWGQYYERIPNDMAIRALTPEFFHFAYYKDAALTHPYGLSYTFGADPTLIMGGPNGSNLKGSYNQEAILGYQYAIRPDLSLGVRGIYRNLGRVIEDISVDGANQYIISNPSKWTNIWVPDVFGRPGYRWKFPKPVRIYKALQFTADKRFSNNWMMQASYTLSRLQGNYEGLYSNDNGQLDPNITSKYDLPQLLVNGYGLLPNDRTHVVNIFGGYFFTNIPLELSGRFTLSSGYPITKYGADNAYGQMEGFSGQRGTAGRTPTIWALDLGAQYTFKLWQSNLALRADIFNVTNEQRTTQVDQNFNRANTGPIGDNPYFGMETAHQTARRIRLALRWTF